MDKASDFGSEDCRRWQATSYPPHYKSPCEQDGSLSWIEYPRGSQGLRNSVTGHGEVQGQGPEMTSPVGKTDQHFVGRDSTAQLLQQMAVLRAELKNLRLKLDQAKRVHRKDVEGIKATLRQEVSPAVGNETEAQVAAPRCSPSPDVSSLETGNLMTRPVGYVESCFPTKNGTPRQPSVCAASRACVRLDKSVFSNAEHSLAGLQHFSHVWILFVFHKNGPTTAKAKVKPPRLNGLKVGVFSTRSPHRPNPIGLSLARLEKIEGGALYLSGIDMIDGTPVLDIKPYIPEYDVPVKAVDGHTVATEDPEARDASPDGEHLRVSNCVDSGNYGNVHSCGSGEPVVTADETGVCLVDASKEPLAHETLEARENSRASAADLATPASEQQSAVASWVREAPVKNLAVRFTPHAEQELQQLANAADKGRSALRHFGSAEEARRAATAVLSADPRSAYRRRSCQDQLFYFHLDGLHLTCWFGDGFAEVLRTRLARPQATAAAATTAAVPEGESKD